MFSVLSLTVLYSAKCTSYLNFPLLHFLILLLPAATNCVFLLLFPLLCTSDLIPSVVHLLPMTRISHHLCCCLLSTHSLQQNWYFLLTMLPLIITILCILLGVHLSYFHKFTYSLILWIFSTARHLSLPLYHNLTPHHLAQSHLPQYYTTLSWGVLSCELLRELTSAGTTWKNI